MTPREEEPDDVEVRGSSAGVAVLVFEELARAVAREMKRRTLVLVLRVARLRRRGHEAPDGLGARAAARGDVQRRPAEAVDRDDVFFSVLGDDPESYTYLLPQLRGQWGVRFINPGGGSGELGAHIDMLDTVLPTRARDGSAIYVARRCAASLPASWA